MREQINNSIQVHRKRVSISSSLIQGAQNFEVNFDSISIDDHGGRYTEFIFIFLYSYSTNINFRLHRNRVLMYNIFCFSLIGKNDT